MNYQVELLNKLLNKYEISDWYYKGISTRRILLDPYKGNVLPHITENAFEKEKFLQALKSLKVKKIIDFSWSKFEENNLVERIWLHTEPQAIQEAYKICQRKPKDKQQTNLIQLLETEKNHVHTLWIKELLEAVLLEAYQKSKQWTPPFSEIELNDVIKVLGLLNQSSGEYIHKRILSTRLFADSKYFERKVQNKLLQLVNRYLEDSTELTDKEKLQQLGIGVTPEIFYISGPVEIELDKGRIDGKLFPKGLYLGADMLSDILQISGTYDEVMTIENLANYYWYLQNEKKETELAIYTGGFLTKNQVILCKLIKMEQVKSIYHWGDIDLGGFRILNQIKTVWNNVEPWKMNLETIIQFENQSKRVERDYLQKVQASMQLPEFQVYRDVLEHIINTEKVLEQEAELIVLNEENKS